MVDVVRLHLYATKNVVPCLATLSLHLVKRSTCQLLEILHSLLLRDEGRGDAHVHLLAAASLEAYDGTCMLAVGL